MISEMNSEKNIDYRFKILYAVAAAMVVCGHIPGGVISIISDWFPYFGFSLALFVFGSGYFYKRSNEETTVRYILEKAYKLLIPMYVYTLIYGLIVQVSRLAGFGMGGDFNLYNNLIAPVTDGHQYIYNMGGWFVVPLFMVETYNVLVRKISKPLCGNISEWFYFFISVALGIVGNYLASIGFHTGWWLVLVRMLYFVPFYSLGILYRSILEKYDRKIPNFWYFSVVFALKLAVVCYCGKMPLYTPSRCNDFTEGAAMPIIVGVLGIALWMRIVTILEPVIGKSRRINAVADSTYSIMMNQFIGFMLIKAIYAQISRIYVGFADFDWTSYKTDIFWYYTPKGISYTAIIYVAAGLAFPVFIQKTIDKLKIRCRLFTIKSNSL